MALRDRISGAIGGALGALGGIAADSMEKAGKSIAETRKNMPGEDLPKPAEDSPRSLMYDPFSVIDQLGYKDRPSGITYNTLSEISRRVPIVAAILQTRVAQMTNFADPQEHEREPGFQIVMRDPDAHPTKADKKRIKAIESWIRNCGSSEYFGKDTFETFIRKYVRDSLTYDQACFEVVDNRKGEPSDFYAVDASTVRIADVPLGAEFDDDPERVRFVQVYDEVVIAEFAAQELCFGVRNARTGIRLNGYGFAEIEQMLTTVTALLWGFEYNKRFFSQGSVTKGILNFRGSIPDSKLDSFRRHWYQQITGVANAWRTPVVNAEELQYVNLHSSNRDMEFSAWLDWLIKVCASIFLMDSSEINFVYGNSGQTSSMFQAPAESRIKNSQDRGLRPMLRFMASNLNRYLVWRIDDNFSIRFTGMDPRNSDQIIDAEKKQVTYLKTVDEVRAENDLAPLPDKKGEVILDPTWLQASQGADMAEQGGEEGFGGGDFGGDQGDQGDQGGQSGGGQGGGFDEMLAQLRGVDKDGAEAEKSLRKATVKQTHADGVEIYELEL